MKLYIFIISFLLLTTTVVAQATKTAQIQKRYVVKDTGSYNKDAMLILYQDNTFLNFGIYNNKEESDSYIWYACGTWANTDSTLTLSTKYDLFDTGFLQKGIKYYYKRRSDYRMIETYYEFIKDIFKEKNLSIKNEILIDIKKKITYSETNT